MSWYINSLIPPFLRLLLYSRWLIQIFRLIMLLSFLVPNYLF